MSPPLAARCGDRCSGGDHADRVWGGATSASVVAAAIPWGLFSETKGTGALETPL